MAIEFLIPGAVPLAELRSSLKLRFPLQDDVAVRLRRDYQDTFDWRLFRKNYHYYCEHKAQQFSLHLIQYPDDSSERVLFQPDQPVFAGDINSPSFRRKMTSLLGIRALMTRFSIVLKQHPLRYVDTDGKTRLYIFLEDYRLLIDKNKTRSLGKRIRLQPVKGYSRAATLITKHLKKDRHFEQAQLSIEAQAYDIMGIVPGDFPSCLDMKLDPEMRTDLALKKILSICLDTMARNEQGILNDIDAEFLHDFRVAVRRSRSLLDQINSVFPASTTQRFSAHLKWLGSQTGPTRDLHVYLLKFDNYRSALPAGRQSDLEPLRRFLVKHLKMEHAALVRVLNSQRYKKFKQSWKSYLDASPPQHTSLANAVLPVKHVADGFIWKAFRKVIKKGAAVTEKCPDEKLHKLRIACKKLRYLLEMLQSMYSRTKIKAPIRSLRKLQDILGDFQDLSIQIDSLNSMQQQMRDEHMMTEEAHQAMDILAQQFHQQKAGLRKRFFVQFAQFADKSNGNLYRELFRPVKVKT